MVGTVLLYLGKDPNSENPRTTSRLAEEVLMAIRPYIQHDPQLEVHRGPRQRRDLPRGGLERRRAAGPGPGRGGRQGRRRSRYVDPEGRRAHVVRHAGHPGRRAARRATRTPFIDYLLRPDVAARNSNFVNYANGNAALAAHRSNEDAAQRPGHLPDARGQGQAAAVTSPESRRVHARC
ncbi:MAG: hypothetical protein MZV49_04880 [Rhodopseudomonas palustris]|nr:hypothetical protein [Rhodopseudomonas palustris]